ncbi:DUF7561 family protein [Natrononativus amylolyticus]|uniref:DUF7561 family protein n=1 Tax=Natrononativus amylolyticus TaxID=2963434 RepID=UPI0020CC9CDC|nr:hypothetical protein [Natrononativus amylolyticus]
MGQDSCDGCGRAVSVTGGIANLWTFGEGSEGTAMVLEFDGEERDAAEPSRYLLCYPCIEALPDNPVPADVDALEAVDEETSRLER